MEHFSTNPCGMLDGGSYYLLAVGENGQIGGI